MHHIEPIKPARLTVTELNRNVRRLLEVSFGTVWVEGELSNYARPSSGHWYFTLKDTQAQIRCAMFRNRNQRVAFTPREGLQVAIRGKLSLYEGRGDYQLIADHMEEAGNGALQAAFEQLKSKLASEGLFNQEHKQPLPTMPSHIAVITSPTGAAIRDILSVLKRRFPAIKVSVFPVAVQGNEAAPQITQAIINASRHPFDLVIIGRGGGSLEDLWPFNEEQVARAIFECPLPTVSAVGHEVDFTISDLVADCRAPTPSAAAELISPDSKELIALIAGYQQLLIDGMQRTMQRASRELELTAKRLRHPGQRLQEQNQRLDDMEMRLRRAIAHQLQASTHQYQNAHQRLQHQQPANLISQLSQHRDYLSNRLQRAMELTLQRQQSRLMNSIAKLDTLSPLATLQRGYSITLSDDSSQVIRNINEVVPGDRIRNRLAQGEIISEVIASGESGNNPSID